MLFNSTAFLAFFALFFPLYWILAGRLKARNTLLLLGSYFFYGSWDWKFLSLILVSTVVDFFCGKGIAASSNVRKRRTLLLISLFTNLGILFVFKYNDFFISSFADLLNLFGMQANYSTLNLILPVGISFYTFQTLSYTIDIYNRRLQPTTSLLNFATFVAFFPQLVAGPIERAKQLIPQIERRIHFNYLQFRDGVFLVLWGLVKKTLIADRLAVYVDAVFANPGDFTGPQSAMAVCFFAIQIYCDFSGYSDIARGLAKMLGIELMVNFNTPYFAASIREFWQRWHISLSTWFRDYVYIPLGGSRTSNFRVKRNLFITFVVSGLWHGAAYTFLIWGFIHAVANMLDPFSKSKTRVNESIMMRCIGTLSTLLIVLFGWVFFRANSLSDAMMILSSITTWSDYTAGGSLAVAMNNTELVLSAYFIGVLFLLDLFLKDRGIDALTRAMRTPARWVFSWFLMLNLVLLAPSDTGAFIYFQF